MISNAKILNKVSANPLPDFKTYYKAIVKIMCY